MVIDFELECDVNSARIARRELEPLRSQVGEELFDDIRLLTNELVTNSVLHSGSDAVEVHVEVRPNTVRVQVSDRGEGRPVVGHTRLLDTSGRGLILVSTLADRWGVAVDGKTLVWFEMNRRG